MVLEILDATGALVLLAAVGVGGLMARRVILHRRGASLGCGLRVLGERSPHGWHLGVVRYTAGHLQWFRVFGATPNPAFTFVRRSIAITGRRAPRGFEVPSIPHGAVVLQCTARTPDGRSHEIELAMSEGALTGFLAWVESAPPGAHQSPPRRAI